MGAADARGLAQIEQYDKEDFFKNHGKIFQPQMHADVRGYKEIAAFYLCQSACLCVARRQAFIRG